MRQRAERSSRHASGSRSDLEVTQRPLEDRIGAFPPPMRFSEALAWAEPDLQGDRVADLVADQQADH